VFGSPFIFVPRREGPPRAARSAPAAGGAVAKGDDPGEPFWGMDRFDQVERWLAQGGF
jgi:hypothetical protein